jgi:DNA polymerase-3 subunit delta'
MPILGQTRALETLANALRSGRFHHAWIFSGPRGVGKFTTAIETARVLLDPEARARLPSTPDPQNLLPREHAATIQSLISAGTHPDLHIIRKELALYSDNRELRERKQLSIPIDLLRERIIGGKSGDTCYDAPAYRSAAYGHGKVFIIDEAELLADNAQNCMLKTLEEPPPETYFFLITSQPDRLLITIRSRCQHVRFSPLDDKAMKQWMSGFAKQNAEVRENATDLLAFAEGSPGLAQLALEYGFIEWRKTLEPMLRDLDAGKFPIAMGDTLAGLIDEFAQAWVKTHKNASKDAANKDGTRHMFSFLASHARQRLKASCEAGDDPSLWLAVIDLINKAQRELESNVNMKLLLENLVVQWARVQQLQHA